MFLSILVPAYNEESTLHSCVHDVLKYLRHRPFASELIVIDDGSTDQTFAIATRLAREYPSMRVLHHTKNKGKGAAIKTGALAANGTYIAYLDADLSAAPESLDQALPFLDRADLVFASRAHPASVITKQQPMSRVYSGKVFNWYIRHVFHLPYRDTQCGSKVFHSLLRPMIQTIESEGWAFDVELIVRARQAGHPVREAPVTWRHHPESRVRFSDAPRIYRELKRMEKRITLPPFANKQ